MKLLVSACLLGLACRYDGSAQQTQAVINLKDTHTLIPFCPEIYGGLAAPREPAEIRNGHVYTCNEQDVTGAYQKGAAETLRLAQLLGCQSAILQDRSPSCGCGTIHNGRFDGGLVTGDGVTTKLLKENGIRVIPASQADTLSNPEIDSSANCESSI